MSRDLDVKKVADLIEEKIKLLVKGRFQLEERAKYKAEALSNYDRKLAIVIIKLRNGEPISIDQKEDTIVKNPPATLIEKIARGVCWEEKLAMELADAEYKLTIEKLKAVESELNGYQSINRYLEKV